jgi:hypothetical protein
LNSYSQNDIVFNDRKEKEKNYSGEKSLKRYEKYLKCWEKVGMKGE